MKHWLLFILVISWFCFPLSGQQTNRPDWVKQHPVSGLSYIGIGMAEISEGDYQQKAKQNAREDNASFMFTESQLNEDDDAAQSTSALVTSNNDVYLSNVGYLFSPMRFRVRGYDSQYSDMYINGVQFNDAETGRFSLSLIHISEPTRP